MSREIIVVVGDLGPSWQIIDRSFDQCPQSTIYYTNTVPYPKDQRVPCDPPTVKCIHTLDGQETTGEVKRREQ